MRKPAVVVPLALVLAVPAAAADRDPAVAGLVGQVTAARLGATDERLVAFGTRSTFSTDAPPGRGIFAARGWVASQLGAIAGASAGRMTVALDTYEQPKTDRTPRASSRRTTSPRRSSSRRTTGRSKACGAPSTTPRCCAPTRSRLPATSTATSSAPRTDTTACAIRTSCDCTRRVWGVEGDQPSAELGRFAKETVERYVPGFTVELIDRADRIRRGGDQNSFQKHGFPAVRFVEASEDYDHEHQDVRVENGREFGDLLKFEDFDYLARVTRGLVATLTELALGPARPANALEAIGPQLDYDAHLQWDKVAGAAGYDVVWRKTTDTMWTNARAVGDVLSATIPGYNRDRFAFGVRAVDASGHRSVVSFCTPQRTQ